MERLFILLEDQQIFSFLEHIEKTKRALSTNENTDFIFDYPGIDVKESFSLSQFVDWASVTKEKSLRL